MVGASPSLAQQGDASSFLQSEERKQQRSWEAMQMSSGLAVPLEGQVDPSAYVVGPGDVFSVFVGGPEPVNLTPTVSAEGDLVLPEVGSLPAADHTLAEVKQAAQSALRESFQNVSLDVSLQRPRTFFVHASGAVHRSGRYTANPVTRVSNVIERAVIDTLTNPVRNPDFEPSFRNITLIRQDGDRQSVDLERYFATGNPEYNPYLRDGDVISVPTYRPDVRSVRVDGNVPFADTYAYRPGDTVLDLLAIATGESPPENVERVRLTRQGGNDAADTRMLDVSALISGEREPVPLRPLDHLSVPGGAQSSSGRATVRGSVKYPGTYHIKPGRTTAEDLVEQAGGLRDGALERAAYLLRDRRPSPERTEEAAFQQTPFQQTRLTGLSFSERQYAVRELNQNRIPVDLSGEEGLSVRLRDKDRLVIPRDRDAVLVTGQVNRPGYVRVRSEFNAEDYIAEAGERTNLATQAYVVKAGTQRYVPLNEAEVQSGDTIFLNRQGGLATSTEMQNVALQERQLAMQKAQDEREVRFNTIQTILSAVGTAVSVVTTAILIGQN
jgi:protein involved in polysaccharide export with SLBB domain